MTCSHFIAQRLKDVATVSDLGGTLQSCKAMEINVEHTYAAHDGSILLADLISLIDEAVEEIKASQTKAVYVVIKIIKE